MSESARQYFQSQIDRKLARCSEITSSAAKAGRSTQPGEKHELEALLTEVQEFKTRLAEMAANDQFAAQVEGLQQQSQRSTGTYTERALESQSPGAAFVASGAFKSLQTAFKSGSLSGRWSSGPVEIPSFYGSKATLLTSDFPFEADVRPGVQPILQRPIVITDLLAQGTTDSATVRYVQETLFTNGAATVAEGDLKPESAFAFDSVDEPVRKIATFLPVSDEMLEDGAQMRSYLDGRLRLAVQLVEETQLLSGNGTAPNLRGLLNRTGLQNLTLAAPVSGTNPSIAEVLYQAITNVRVNALVEPDGIVMHPTNYATLRLAKDSRDEFNAGGPFGALAGNTVWGLPVALSHALPVGTALVGAFKTQAQLFRRNGLTVEASNSHADFFQHNLTALRAEVRVGLACYRPSAFVRVAGLQYAGVSA